MEKKEKYSANDLFEGNRCPDCGAEVMLVWAAQGKTYECMGCGKELSSQPYPKPKDPEKQ